MTRNGIRTGDGRERRVDAIICGTGFTATDYLAPLRLVGIGLLGHAVIAAGCGGRRGLGGSGFVTLGEIIRCDFAKYPNVQRWIGNMKKLKSWPAVNEVFYGFAASVKDKEFVAL